MSSLSSPDFCQFPDALRRMRKMARRLLRTGFAESIRRLLRPSHFLVCRQSPDGAWRSPTYGAFKDGDSLTGLAVIALEHLGAAERSRR